jgi:nicotinate-nucleotide pyrophosphorylase (carboxylating)
VSTAQTATDAVWDEPLVAALIDLALEEDLGEGDRTTGAIVGPFARGRGRMIAKEGLVVCGLPLLQRVYEAVGAVHVTRHVEEGTQVASGTVLASIDGEGRALLSGERVALNFVQHLSGIATLTRACVERVAGTRLTVRDTRKTVPGLRVLAKYAVRTGGGSNHRRGLDDGILIKDNHLALADANLGEAVRRVRLAHPTLPLEVECRALSELDVAIAAEPDLILLDNMSPDDLAAAVAHVAGRVPLEASGGVTLDTLPAIAATGVDYVAIGALTHSAPAVDVSLRIEPIR